MAHAFLLVFPSVVAVYLKESWWSIEDILRTSDPTLSGLLYFMISCFPLLDLSVKNDLLLQVNEQFSNIWDLQGPTAGIRIREDK